MSFQKYVLGFVFNQELNKVALIKKNRPSFLAGKLNGIGGKVEANETDIDALTREVEEEAGVRIPSYSWKPCGEIKDNDFIVFVAATKVNNLDHFKTLTDEEVIILDIKDSEIDNNGASQLRQIISHCLSNLKK